MLPPRVFESAEVRKPRFA